ncbi:hypothetical protein JMN32_06940 [Fulvivirga sp. 29W222]|uniref:Uncharacterized protein n=1 Tax=Fulvivirga marina TaxID=2494733 RepID=A0A937FWN0_9BACT|nr:hypothetical protein [Fulvivirga marina]MBL6446037.1 hypothetical protein [Fulvivirga marina]
MFFNYYVFQLLPLTGLEALSEVDKANTNSDIINMHRETVSPQKAIMIGLVTVNIPVLIIMLGVGVGLFQLSFH